MQVASASSVSYLLRLVTLVGLLFLHMPAVYAERTTGSKGGESTTRRGHKPKVSVQARPKNQQHASSSVFDVKLAPDRQRSIFWIPLGSFLLPGLDQWWEGQNLSAAGYSGVALGGWLYADSVRRNDHVERSGRQREGSEGQEEGSQETSEPDSKDVSWRKYTLGNLIYQGAGGMSAYHAFRTAVRTRQRSGQYSFLRYEETPQELLMAPFDFRYLQRTSTLLPLGIGAVVAALIARSDLPEPYVRDSLSSADWAFTAAYSYNAGTHEEAVFRGWLMPVFFEYWNSPFWSNAAQAGIFALAHISSNPRPLPQLLLGYYLGEVTIDNDWRLGEAIFIHTWWDVLAFASNYTYRKSLDKKTASLVPPPVLWLPPLAYRF